MIAGILQFVTALIWTVLCVSFLGLAGTILRGMYRAWMEVGGNRSDLHPRLRLDQRPGEVRQIMDRAYKGTHKKWLKSIVLCFGLLLIFRILTKLLV